jgi:hypothetical protein
MQGIVYVIVWIVLLAIPALAAWKRKWWPFDIYVLGCLLFLSTSLRVNDGWDDLADFAMLVTIVIPIYIVATIVWIAGSIWVRNRNNDKKQSKET